METERMKQRFFGHLESKMTIFVEKLKLLDDNEQQLIMTRTDRTNNLR